MKYRISFVLLFSCFFCCRPGRRSAPRPIPSSKPAKSCWTRGAQPRPKNSPPKRSRKTLSPPAALEFDARVKFYQGRYAEALAVLERALAIDSTNQRRQALKLLTQFTVDVHKSLKRHESAHFVLFADDKRDGILVAHALDALEKSYASDRRGARLLSERKSPRRNRARTRPASTPFRRFRCAISKRPAPSASASSTSS